ncbi:MAG TPA: hypothetical protein PLA65_05500 [Spirochaetota bacterium]|nr:hypothetical protein [Spirochaetota bacterium]HPN11493.1 hypothetical protein [Spirochaetota bacterium]
MSKMRFAWLFLLAAFILTSSTLFAQMKKEEAVQPIQQEKPKGPEKVMIFNGDFLKVQLYGFVKFDMVYNTTDVYNESGPFMTSNQVLYYNPLAAVPGLVVPAAGQRNLISVKKTASQNSGSFLMDMRTTRLGLRITGPTVLLAKTSANLEIDFWGTAAAAGTGERCGMPMMRHAFAQLAWPSGTTLTIGQTWSLVMAMTAQPITVTYVPFGQNGNLFQREPQIALGQKIGNDNYNLTIEAAAARSMAGVDTGVATDLYPGVSGVVADDRGPGEASRYPAGRAKITLTLKPHDMVNIILGATGHYQLEKHALTFANLANTNIWGATTPLAAAEVLLITQRWGKLTPSYSAGGFAKISISLVSLVATYWRGVNMDQFSCGIGAGQVENFSSTKILGVPAQGGYAQLQIDLRKVGPIPLAFNVGYGGILKSNKRYINYNIMLWNEAIVANAFWYINDYLWLGFEFGRHQSKYKGALGSAIDYKYHTGVSFNF